MSRLDLLSPAEEARLSDARQLLLKRRAARVAPGFDDKVLADWNGLMIAALAEAGLVFERADWVTEAGHAFDAVLRLLWNGEILHHSYRAGKTRNLATADGYAQLISAGLALFEATGDARRLEQAENLASALMRDYWDDEFGGFYFTSRRSEHLLLRQRYAHDDATPNANGTMMANFARLEALTGKSEYRRRAEAIHDAFAGAIRKTPFAFASSLSAFLDLTDLVQAVLIGSSEATAGLRRALLDEPLPARLLIPIATPDGLSAGHPAASKAAGGSRPALYLCRGQTCSLPVTRPDEVSRALNAIA